MGAWGINTFENDHALDWLDGFLREASVQKLLAAVQSGTKVIQPGYLGRLLGKKAMEIPVAPVDEQVLAASEIMATLRGYPTAVTGDVLDSLTSLTVPDNAAQQARMAIENLLEDSNLKECWEETDDYDAWQAAVKDLHTRLGLEASS